MTTEAEAKEKWCPMVRAGRIGANYTAAVNWPGGGAEVVGEQEWAKCIGRGCMMWRWGGTSPNVVDTPPHGWCGLASRPDL